MEDIHNNFGIMTSIEYTHNNSVLRVWYDWDNEDDQDYADDQPVEIDDDEPPRCTPVVRMELKNLDTGSLYRQAWTPHELPSTKHKNYLGETYSCGVAEVAIDAIKKEPCNIHFDGNEAVCTFVVRGQTVETCSVAIYILKQINAEDKSDKNYDYANIPSRERFTDENTITRGNRNTIARLKKEIERLTDINDALMKITITE
jgi:hypothetical protein